MNFYKRFVVRPVLLTAAMIASPSMHAQAGMRGHDEACRQGQYNPLVGVWTGNLDFTLLGKATVIVSINQGGTFTETDSVDLNGLVGITSPGYAAWKALDCRHYTLTINKMLYDPKQNQFSRVVLPGTLELSEDGQSWTVSIKQHVYNEAGTETASGGVTGSAKRVIPTSE